MDRHIESNLCANSLVSRILSGKQQSSYLPITTIHQQIWYSKLFQFFDQHAIGEPFFSQIFSRFGLMGKNLALWFSFNRPSGFGPTYQPDRISELSNGLDCTHLRLNHISRKLTPSRQQSCSDPGSNPTKDYNIDRSNLKIISCYSNSRAACGLWPLTIVVSTSGFFSIMCSFLYR